MSKARASFLHCSLRYVNQNLAATPEVERTFVSCSANRSRFSFPVNSGNVNCGRRSGELESSLTRTD